ncbi:Vesicle transport protein GOT1, partial [Cucurbita argyrosperma subsp. argyrosperma]
MVSFEMNDRKKCSVGFMGFNMVNRAVIYNYVSFQCKLLTPPLFFDSLNQILFVSGVTLTIGLKSTMQFFMKRQNFKGTISFGLGFFFVIIGWPIFGMILETYGFIVLFSGFWPTLAVFIQKIPILGWLFQQPFVR